MLYGTRTITVHELNSHGVCVSECTMFIVIWREEIKKENRVYALEITECLKRKKFYNTVILYHILLSGWESREKNGW